MRRVRHSSPWSLRSLIATALLSVVVIVLFSQSLMLLPRSDEQSITTNLVLQMVLLAVFWWWSTLHSGSFLNAPFVLLLAIFFWHSSFLAGRYLHLAEVFGYSGIFLTYGEEFVPIAVAFVSFCMILAVLGSAVALWQCAERRTETRTLILHPAVERYALVLFGLYVLLTILYVTRENALASQDYLDIYAQASGSVLYRLYHMTKFLGVAFIAMAIATARSKISLALVYAGTAFLILVSALTGARTMPFLYGATILIAVDSFRRRIPLIAIMAAAFIGAVVSEIVTETRANGVGLQMFSFIYGGQPISSLWRLVWGSGAGLSTVLRTMAFSARTGLEHGRSFADALIYFVPGPLVKLIAPGWTVEPPSEWVLKQSSDMAPGEGLGYSLVAEAFLNFGMWGCLLFLAIGWLVAYHYFRFRFRRDIFSALQSLNLVVLLSLHLRNDSITYVRVLIWAALLIWSARLLNNRSSQTVNESINIPLPRQIA